MKRICIFCGSNSGLLNVDDFYGPLLALFDRAAAEGFVRDLHRRLVLVEKDPEKLLEMLAVFLPPAIDKWIDLDET